MYSLQSLSHGIVPFRHLLKGQSVSANISCTFVSYYWSNVEPAGVSHEISATMLLIWRSFFLFS